MDKKRKGENVKVGHLLSPSVGPYRTQLDGREEVRFFCLGENREPVRLFVSFSFTHGGIKHASC